MIVVQLSTGKTICIDPRHEVQIRSIDSLDVQRFIRRVAIVNSRGTRVDLPAIVQPARVWIEQVYRRGECRGEQVSIRRGCMILIAVYYYSDDRIVID